MNMPIAKTATKITLASFILSILSFSSIANQQNVDAMEAPSTTDSTAVMSDHMTEKKAAELPENNKSLQTDSNTAPIADMTGFSRGSVMRSIFTTQIDNREPVDKIKQVPEKSNDVFYFTELRDMSGQTAKHRWEYKGKVIAEVKFNVRGPRWRVWSKKSFIPGWSGDWKVSVINGANEVISEEVIAFNMPTVDIIESEQIEGNNLKNNSLIPDAKTPAGGEDLKK